MKIRRFKSLEELIRLARGTSWTKKFLEGEGECWNALKLKKKVEKKNPYANADEKSNEKLK